MTFSDDNTLRLKDFLPYRLSVLSNRISGAIAELYQERFGLTIQEWRIMAVLGEQPDLSAAEIARRTAMDKVAVSRAVKSLLESGHIERHFSASDRRRSVIALSDSGAEVYSKIAPMAAEYEASILNEMSEEERTWLVSILDKLDEIQLHNEQD